MSSATSEHNSSSTGFDSNKTLYVWETVCDMKPHQMNLQKKYISSSGLLKDCYLTLKRLRSYPPSFSSYGGMGGGGSGGGGKEGDRGRMCYSSHRSAKLFTAALWGKRHSLTGTRNAVVKCRTLKELKFSCSRSSFLAPAY